MIDHMLTLTAQLKALLPALAQSSRFLGQRQYLQCAGRRFESIPSELEHQRHGHRRNGAVPLLLLVVIAEVATT